MAKEIPVFTKPESLTDKKFHYCPGCDHGVVHRLVAEVMDELGIRKDTIGIASVGCSVFSYYYFNCDMVQCPHGRAPAVATGVKRSVPDKIVFTYQGDGDFTAIGTAESIHAANRGENITVIFINNAIYGMTGGQMAPTTLEGMKTTTSPYGRNHEVAGYPIRFSEMLSMLKGSAYVARTSVDTAMNINKTKKAIKKAFEMQRDKKGFTVVEVLAICPTNWKMTPKDSHEFVRTDLMKEYPLGVFKDITGEEGPKDPALEHSGAEGAN